MPATSVAHVVNFAQQRQLREEQSTGRITLTSEEEIVAFLQHLIQTSPRKYADLAREAGMCGTTIANIGYGETKNPSSRTFARLLGVFRYRIVAAHYE